MSVPYKILKKTLIPGIALLGVLLLRNIDIPEYKSKTGLYYVKYVIDGDTIVVGNNEKVRYIGIDTPEILHPKKGPETYEYLAKEAMEFNRGLVLNKWVRLEFDVEKRDKYNRLLAYVFKDDVFVNAELVKEGYASVYTFPPNVKHYDLLLKLERDARKAGIGLWAKKKR